MNIDIQLIDRIKGFLDKKEGKRLYETAIEASGYAPCLEIGSYCGKSAIYLGTACKTNGQILFSIDHHRGSEEQQPGEEYFDPSLFDSNIFKVNTFETFRETLELTELEETVVPIVCPSHVAARSWSTRLSLVFIDGGHADTTAFTDYNAWAGHIIPGGYLLIHDIFPNPEDGGQAPYNIYKFALASGLFRELPMTGTLGVLQRLSCNEIGDEIPSI